MLSPTANRDGAVTKNLIVGTVISFILLLTGAVGALPAILPPEGVILVLSLMAEGRYPRPPTSRCQ